MRVRVAGLYRHPKSKMWWFRMVVPERYRVAAGKREWKYSLETSDESEARLRHAEKLAEIRRYMAGLDVQEAASVGDRADEIVARGMTALARSNIVHQASIGLNFDMARGLDNVTYAILKVLSFRVRLGWGGKHAAAAQRQRFSAIDPDAEDDTPEFAPDLPPKPDRRSRRSIIASWPLRRSKHSKVSRAIRARRSARLRAVCSPPGTGRPPRSKRNWWPMLQA